MDIQDVLRVLKNGAEKPKDDLNDYTKGRRDGEVQAYSHAWTLVKSLSISGLGKSSVYKELLITELNDKRCIGVEMNEEMWYRCRKETAQHLLDNYKITPKYSFSDDLQSCIDAEKEDRVKKIETFVPAFENDTICHFFWVKRSKYPLP